MKQFLKKIAIFSLLVGLLMLAAEHIITKGLTSSQVGLTGSWNQLFRGSIQADVLINGSSKAYSNISPWIIDSVLLCNSYNLGISGNNFLSQYYKYQAYLAHNAAPKLVVQVVGNSCLKESAGLYNLYQFLPYIDHPPIKKLLQHYQYVDFFDYHFPFKRYFGEKKAIEEGFLNYFLLADTLQDKFYKGSYLADKPWDNSFELFVQHTPNGREIIQDQYLGQLMEQFLVEQHQAAIQTVLVYAPTYQPSHAYIKNRAAIINYYSSLAAKYQVPFLNYSNLALTKNKELFFNSQHLNRKGAQLFSRILAKDLKQYL